MLGSMLQLPRLDCNMNKVIVIFDNRQDEIINAVDVVTDTSARIVEIYDVDNELLAVYNLDKIVGIKLVKRVTP